MRYKPERGTVPSSIPVAHQFSIFHIQLCALDHSVVLFIAGLECGRCAETGREVRVDEIKDQSFVFADQRVSMVCDLPVAGTDSRRVQDVLFLTGPVSKIRRSVDAQTVPCIRDHPVLPFKFKNIHAFMRTVGDLFPAKTPVFQVSADCRAGVRSAHLVFVPDLVLSIGKSMHRGIDHTVGVEIEDITELPFPKVRRSVMNDLRLSAPVSGNTLYPCDKHMIDTFRIDHFRSPISVHPPLELQAFCASAVDPVLSIL